MKSKMTGPALGGVETRWTNEADLYSWIRNSQAMIASGSHPRATELWNEWKPTVMNSFPGLTDADIANILAYIKCTNEGNCPGDTSGQPQADPCADPVAKADTSKPIYIAMFLLLAIMAVVLARAISNLNYMAELREKGEATKPKTLVEILTSKGVVSFLIFLAILLGGYLSVKSSINFGRQTGYQPDQPIQFSHKVHACQQKIDCNYCHDGARRSKHAGIPAANTCMNCHKAVKKGTITGTAEIAKIYASVGFDPTTDKYITDYDKMSMDEIKRIYTKFIADTYITDKGKLDEEGEELMESEWNGIVKSLTDDEKGDSSVYGPIEWTRVHNLPDHVYFNHSQHVAVGKIACQQCHGKVEKMDVVKQYTPLSMGWCISCHRKTEVKFADNNYYDNYFEMYHKELKNGSREKVTVEDIGGTECQKCHY